MEGIFWGIPMVMPILSDGTVLPEENGKKDAADEIPAPPAQGDKWAGIPAKPGQSASAALPERTDGGRLLSDPEDSYQPAAKAGLTDRPEAAKEALPAAGYDDAYTAALENTDSRLSAFWESTYDMTGKSVGRPAARMNPSPADTREGPRSPVFKAGGQAETERSAPLTVPPPHAPLPEMPELIVPLELGMPAPVPGGEPDTNPLSGQPGQSVQWAQPAPERADESVFRGDGGGAEASADRNVITEKPHPTEKEAVAPAQAWRRSVEREYALPVESTRPEETAQNGLVLRQGAGKGAFLSSVREEEPLLPGRGGMASLERVRALPYALYLFGNADRKLRESDGEDSGAENNLKGAADRQFGADYLRLSEAVRMAAVVHSLYWGGSGCFEEGVPWYTAYTHYAVKKGMILEDDFPDYNDFATRAQTAYIFANALPWAELRPIGPVRLPEELGSGRYGDSILILCRAGILTGIGAKGSFRPEERITRAEASVMMGRMITPGDRKLPL